MRGGDIGERGWKRLTGSLASCVGEEFCLAAGAGGDVWGRGDDGVGFGELDCVRGGEEGGGEGREILTSVELGFRVREEG